MQSWRRSTLYRGRRRWRKPIEYLGISRHAEGAPSVCAYAWNERLGISRQAGKARSVCGHAWKAGLGISRA
eukprot:7525569-Pyramimonas_sp.AAC.1